MSHSDAKSEFGTMRYGAFAIGVLLSVLVSIHFLVLSVDRPTDVETKRGLHRIAIREKLGKEENAKLFLLEKPEWINKESGIVRLPIEVAMELTLKRMEGKKPEASAIKVDSTPVPASDSPNMPSSPSGAVNIRFRSVSVSPIKNN